MTGSTLTWITQLSPRLSKHNWCACSFPQLAATCWTHPPVSIWPVSSRCRSVWHGCPTSFVSHYPEQPSHQGVSLHHLNLLHSKWPFRDWRHAPWNHPRDTILEERPRSIWLYICWEWCWIRGLFRASGCTCKSLLFIQLWRYYIPLCTGTVVFYIQWLSMRRHWVLEVGAWPRCEG